MTKQNQMKAGSILEEARLHLEELLQLSEDVLTPPYKQKIEDVILRLKLWKPEIFIYLEGGNIQGASANCNMVFNLWDDDNKKCEAVENIDESSDGNAEFEAYEHDKETWNWMIEQGHKDGSLISIY